MDLLLTLGHNSSVIVVDDGQILAGYETERITGVKSDSRFPEDLVKDLPAAHKVYVTHWEPLGSVDSLAEKYWRPNKIRTAKGNIISCNLQMTHHDTHAWAGLWFAGDDFPHPDTLIVVCDGFGNFGEHLSIYRPTADGPALIDRFYGYGGSLGLMYQYATAFLGMKMHEDEYKILGYEVHAFEFGHQISHLQESAKKLTDYVMKQLSTSPLKGKFDPVLSVSALPDVQAAWNGQFQKILDEFGIGDNRSHEARCVIGFIVQATLEAVMLEVLRVYNPRNLILSGGVFYNVKLNKILTDSVKGKVCVYPLAGDQGNALGMYYAHNRDFKFPGHLFWGHRKLNRPDSRVPGMYFVDTPDEARELCKQFIEQHGFVNIVRGAMEFGPRALCHTSTLAKPEPKYVEAINSANGRNTVMPMAPVMQRVIYRLIFKDTHKIWKSEKYMITAMEYADSMGGMYSGAAHFYPGDAVWTGRPQVIDDDDMFMFHLLTDFRVLINTSFNVHGRPIAFDTESVVENHWSQYQRDHRFNTVVLTKG